MKRPAIVIVTFMRQQLLSELLDSILDLTVAPWRIVVVDNENSAETAAIVADFGARANELWGTTDDEPDSEGGTSRADYDPMPENTGGSGGFSEGVRRAYELGAGWFWVMDDDVAVLPDGLEKLDGWSKEADAIQGQRYDFDGGPFFWQYHMNTAMGIYNPFLRSTWRDGERYKECNVMCFEGGCFSRSVVDKIGVPDYRFFIYWDDALYGYLASKVTKVLLVPDYVLRRRREVSNREIGSVRQLNSTSDMTRYYITRNRGYIARYYALYGDYHRFAFGVGTFLTFVKEFLRMILVDRSSMVSGTKRLVAGWKDERRILRDSDWEPMPPMVSQES